MGTQSAVASLVSVPTQIQLLGANLSVLWIRTVGWDISADPTGVPRSRIRATLTPVGPVQGAPLIDRAMPSASVKRDSSPNQIQSQVVDQSAFGIQTAGRDMFVSNRDVLINLTLATRLLVDQGQSVR